MEALAVLALAGIIGIPFILAKEAEKAAAERARERERREHQELTEHCKAITDRYKQYRRRY